MFYNYNDILRNKICNKNKEELCELYEISYYNKNENLLKLMLLDYYKICFLNNGKVKEDNFNYEDFLFLINEDLNFVSKLIMSVKKFNKLSYIEKLALMEEISKTNIDKRLLSISHLHLLDKITYNFDYDLKNMEFYYRDFKSKYPKNPESAQITTSFFYIKLRELKSKDLNKYKEILLNMLKEYFKWKIFIKDHAGEHLLNPEDLIYINKISSDLNRVVNEIDLDFNFLTTIIGEYFFNKTNILEIDEKIIDEYIDKQYKLF